jgi:hypothetical protein
LKKVTFTIMRSKAHPYSFFILVLLMFVGMGGLQAQESSINHYLGFELKTNGFGLHYTNVTSINQSSWQRTISTGVSSLKHPKEIKIQNPKASNPTPYVFGKLHKVSLVHCSPGLIYDAIPRHKNNHLGLSFLFSAGPEVAILKPIYLRINKANQPNDAVFIMNEKYNPEVHTDQSLIEGYSRSKFGWTELAYQMGIYVNPAVRIEWGKDQINSKAIVVGSRFDLFMKDLPVLATKEQSRNFGAFYIQFLWGFTKL